jgi:predicted transcriptional regulator
MREDALSQIASEFKLWGVKFTSRDTNGNHVEVQWQATPDKEIRRYVIAKTSSDWRGPLNAISHIRRTFKADGLTLKKQECAREKPMLAKALALPEPVEKDADQIRMLRAEVADLTELVLEMASEISVVRELVQIISVSPAVVPAAPVVEMPQFLPPESAPPSPPPPPAPAPKKKPTTRIKAIDFISEAWSSTEALARDMGLHPRMAHRKLYYLMQCGRIEQAEGRWRKKIKVEPTPLFTRLPKTPSPRNIKTIDFVSDAWNTTEALARDMGLSNGIAYHKLYYLMKKDIIELSGDRWRKKQKIKVAPAVIAMTRRKKTRANGRSKH